MHAYNGKLSALFLRKEFLSLATAWITDLEDIMMTDANHTERQKSPDFTYMWNLKQACSCKEQVE